VAIAGLVVFVLLVVAAARNNEFHLGLAALFAALVFGVFASGLTPDQVIAKFPTRLFLTLVSVTLLFAIAETNGTLAIIAERATGLCNGRVRLLPPLIFIFTFLLSALGVGNIAATALMAPTAMALAKKIKLSAFLMTLVVVGGANAASLSPFSLTGILLGELTMKAVPTFSFQDTELYLIQIFFLTFVLVAFVHTIGFITCGGATWWRQNRLKYLEANKSIETHVMNRSQWATLCAIIAFACGIFMGNSTIFAELLGSKWHQLGSQLIAIALGLIVLLMLTRLVKIERAIEKIPWSTITLLTGVITYLGVLENAGAIAWATSLIQENPIFGAMVPTLAIGSSVLSSISSSSGVVLPLFIPMVPGLAIDTTSAMYLIATVAVSAHLVDCSPFSTLGALSLASAKKELVDGNERLFSALLLWGLVMIPVSVALLWALSPFALG
jgi:di/tricarboxylate transporter